MNGERALQEITVGDKVDGYSRRIPPRFRPFPSITEKKKKKKEICDLSCHDV